MNKTNKFTTALFATLFSTAVFAEEVAQTTVAVPQPENVQVVTTPTTTAPVVQQVTNPQVATPVVATTPTETIKAVDPNAVNINLASAAEIQDKLNGIGAKKAQAIVDYRTKNGAFSSIEQLKEVSGIGEATLDKNRSRIVLQ